MASVDIEGFDNVINSLKRLAGANKKAERIVEKITNAAIKKAVQLSPRIEEPNRNRKAKPGQLKKSWEAQDPKFYSGTGAEVGRAWSPGSRAPHAHLIDLGHNIVTTGGSSFGNTKTGKTGKMSKTQRAAKEVKTHGRVDGQHIVEQAKESVASRFMSEADALFDEIMEDFN